MRVTIASKRCAQSVRRGLLSRRAGPRSSHASHATAMTTSRNRSPAANERWCHRMGNRDSRKHDTSLLVGGRWWGHFRLRARRDGAPRERGRDVSDGCRRDHEMHCKSDSGQAARHDQVCSAFRLAFSALHQPESGEMWSARRLHGESAVGERGGQHEVNGEQAGTQRAFEDVFKETAMEDATEKVKVLVDKDLKRTARISTRPMGVFTTRLASGSTSASNAGASIRSRNAQRRRLLNRLHARETRIA